MKKWLKNLINFRVKRWHTATRGWGEEDIRVLICLQDDIWYWALLDWLAAEETYICHWLHSIPLPKWVRNWKRAWDTDEPTEIIKFGEWFGDDLGGLWHVFICTPLMQWTYRHLNPNQPMFELTLDEARSKFANDAEVWKWVEKELEQHRIWDAEDAENVNDWAAAGEEGKP